MRCDVMQCDVMRSDQIRSDNPPSLTLTTSTTPPAPRLLHLASQAPKWTASSPSPERTPRHGATSACLKAPDSDSDSDRADDSGRFNTAATFARARLSEDARGCACSVELALQSAVQSVQYSQCSAVHGTVGSGWGVRASEVASLRIADRGLEARVAAGN